MQRGYMSDWLFSDSGISEDPRNGLQDLLAHYDEDIDGLLDVLAEFFLEYPETWHQFCAAWVQWHESETHEDGD